MNKLFALSVATALLAAGTVRGETLTVPENTEVTAEASVDYDSITVNGTLTVPSGITIKGLTNNVIDSLTSGTRGSSSTCPRAVLSSSPTARHSPTA